MKLFLDDVRDPLNCISYMHTRIGALNPIYDTTKVKDWIIVRNYKDFCNQLDIRFGEIEIVSFDHDLVEEHYEAELTDAQEWEDYHFKQDREMTGLDCAKYLKDFYDRNMLQLPTIIVHSMNPIGRKNIENIFK